MSQMDDKKKFEMEENISFRANDDRIKPFDAESVSVGLDTDKEKSSQGNIFLEWVSQTILEKKSSSEEESKVAKTKEYQL